MKNRTGDWDLGYFDVYPSPMYEAMTRLNPTETMNGTTPHYGPLLYILAKILGAHSVLEIGIAEGWSSGFMAWAIKENNTRYGMNGRYYGLDIGDKSFIQKAHDELGLPSTFIQHEPGSVDFLEHQTLWQPESFDLIFVDGLHEVNYVRREVELLYPLLKGNGNGYMCHHDIYAWCEKIWPELVAMQAPDINGVMRPAWESLRFLNNYGFGILRKMEKYDHSKVFWPDGDQRELAIAQGFLDENGKVKARVAKA